MREAFIWNRYFYFFLEFVWLTLTCVCACAICVAMSTRRIEGKLNWPCASATTYLFFSHSSPPSCDSNNNNNSFDGDTHTHAHENGFAYIRLIVFFPPESHIKWKYSFLCWRNGLCVWDYSCVCMSSCTSFVVCSCCSMANVSRKFLFTETALRASHHFAAQVCVRVCVCSNVCQTCFGMSAENVLFRVCSTASHMKVNKIVYAIITTRRRKSICLVAINITLICGVLSIVWVFVASVQSLRHQKWTQTIVTSVIRNGCSWRYFPLIRILLTTHTGSHDSPMRSSPCSNFIIYFLF